MMFFGYRRVCPAVCEIQFVFMVAIWLYISSYTIIYAALYVLCTFGVIGFYKLLRIFS